MPISQLRKTELAIGRAVDFNYGKAVFNLFRCSDSLYCYLVGTVIPKYRSLGWTFEYRAGDFRDSLRRLVEMLYMNVSKFAPIERVLLSCALLVASVMWTCKSRLVPVSVVSWCASSNADSSTLADDIGSGTGNIIWRIYYCETCECGYFASMWPRLQGHASTAQPRRGIKHTASGRKHRTGEVLIFRPVR